MPRKQRFKPSRKPKRVVEVNVATTPVSTASQEPFASTERHPEAGQLVMQTPDPCIWLG